MENMENMEVLEARLTVYKKSVVDGRTVAIYMLESDVVSAFILAYGTDDGIKTELFSTSESEAACKRYAKVLCAMVKG